MVDAVPTVLKGTRDVLPREMMHRNRAVGLLRRTFERFGYLPIETPILCPAEMITGKYGEEGDVRICTFTAADGRRMALPYELTVPFSRFVAMNSEELTIPFKRYQMQRVWRNMADGSVQENFQCDVDIIGSDSLLCEAELAELIVTVFNELGLPGISIKVNSHGLINQILKSYGVERQVTAVIKSMDRASAIGTEALADELRASGVRDVERILELLRPEETNEETLSKLERYDDVSRLREFLRYCSDLNLQDSVIKIDPLFLTHLDYYTGLIFEAVPDDDPVVGTLCVGGRYAGLSSSFQGPDFSGAGVGFEFERIMEVVKERGLFRNHRAVSQALVTNYDAASVDDALRIYRELIDARIPAELYLGTGGMEEQMRFAGLKSIPFVIIRSPEDRDNEEVTIVRTQSGKRKRISINQLVAYLVNYYEAQ